MSDLKGTLDQFAEEIAQQARGEATPLDQKLDTFKALTTYYGLLLKRRKDGEDPDDDEPTMDDLRDAIQGEHNGRTASRIRSS